jgi:hypothetical protein
MYYPDTGQVPEYFERGISFAQLLENYKRYRKDFRDKPLRSSPNDTDSTAHSRDVSPMSLPRDRVRGATIAHSISALPIARGGIQKLALRAKARLENLATSDQSRMVFLAVQNLPYMTTENELRNHFSHISRVARIQIERLPDGKSAGQGLVAFYSRKDFNTVIDALQGSNLRDRQLSLSRLD